MKMAKIGVFAIVVLIASAGMGISYASINGVPLSNGEDPSYYGNIGIRAVSDGDNDSGPGRFDFVRVYDTTYRSDKNVGNTNFSNNGTAEGWIMIDDEQVYFWNHTDPSPTLTLTGVYPCYASSITIWFGNFGQYIAYIDTVDLDEVSGLIIDDWELKIDGTKVANGSGKAGLISTLEDDDIIYLNQHQYLSVHIEFHFDNSLPENIEDELFEYKFTWWGPDDP